MNIGHLEIMARDPHVTAEFYCALLDVQIETVQHETYIWLATSPIPILLRPGRSEHHDAGYQDSSSAIVIYTSQLEAELARLAALGIVPSAYDGSPLCPLFRDPDGTWIQLVDPLRH